MDQKYLKEIIDYDYLSGRFTWRAKRPGTRGVGALAGNPMNNGYWQINIDGSGYLAHRLAFLWVNGEWPACCVDHINGDRADNRWENLRQASYGENQQNMKLDKRNKSGFRGVSWSKSTGKWQASIQVNKVPRHLGFFDSPEVAGQAYLQAKSRLHKFNPTVREVER